MNPIAFHIGPLDVHWYGILIVTGIFVALYLSMFLARLRGQTPEFLWDALIWCVILGVVGARLYHVFTPPPSMGVDQWYYFRNPLQIFAVWNGGLGIYGAMVGGVLGLFIAARRAKQDMLLWLDIMTPGLALAQAIGRWGNFINQELYGRPTDLPWGIFIAPDKRLSGFEAFERFHPTFFYESVGTLLICLGLVYLTWRHRDKLATGIISALYLIAYALVRFLLEFVRLDSPTTSTLTIAQIVSLVAIVLVTGFVIWRSRQAVQVHDEQDI